MRAKFNTMQASPEILRGSSGSIGEWVTVNIVGVHFGGKNDWVGVFAPEDISPEVNFDPTHPPNSTVLLA